MKPSTLLPIFLTKKLSAFKTHLKKEQKYYDDDVSLIDKVWLWRNGFYSGHKSLYSLNKDNINSFLSPMDYRKLHPLNGVFSSLIDNKGFLPLIVSNTTELYIVFEKGIERIRKGLATDDTIRCLNDYTANGGSLIMKPLGASGGDGFKLIGEKSVENEIAERIKNKESFLIQEKVKQHDYTKNIYPESVNSIRIVLYRDLATKKIKIAGAAHRFGTSESQPVDNAGKGGMITAIDENTGILGKSYVYKGKKFAGIHSKHPDTNNTIEKLEIPDWKSKINEIIASFDSATWFEYGGLDVVFTQKGYIILEINSLPDPELIQVTKPYLNDKSLLNFFISKGLKRKVVN